jgi:hypothetical protein
MNEREIKTGLFHQKQECVGNYKFNGKANMTINFVNEFGGEIEATKLALKMLIEIWKIRDTVGADYLQVFIKDGTKIYVIDDVENFTVMLASDY